MPVNTDVYPPNRVTDLRVVAVQVDARTMTIVWTAPGDDLDTGRGFVLFYSDTSFEHLKI